MTLRSVSLGASLASLLGSVTAGSGPSAADATVRLDIATIHAAALSSPRSAADSSDTPYILIAALGPGGTRRASRLPADSAHRVIRLDEALKPQPLTTLNLRPGDSVRVLVSLLEGAAYAGPADDAAANASAEAVAASGTQQGAALRQALTPLTGRGDNLLGAAIFLVTNEGGTAYWRAIDCVATCKVLNRPPKPELAAAPAASVLELTGAGATYHMQVSGRRTGL